MADIVDRGTRSRMMAAIKGRDTKPELVVRRSLHRSGLRFRLHARELPGRPDIVLRRHRAVVFVNGCFWHRHRGCKYAYTPKSRVAFWSRKLEGNVVRDAVNARHLRALGWRVFTIWECQVGQPAVIEGLVRRIRQDPRDG